MIKWQWASFDELTTHELYTILKIRQAIFIVEQECAYLDADNLDLSSWHLLGWQQEKHRKELVAYLRVVSPGKKFPEPSIGRVLVAPKFRQTGLGKQLTAEAIALISAQYPNTAIRISAQQYLKKFYVNFGFKKVSTPYLEDGILHIEMLRSTDSDSK